jgi:mono/diheme cytochrome c family protein
MIRQLRQLAGGLALCWLAAPALAAEPGSGEYLVRAAGCIACHTAEDGEPLAGGHALETPFGTFYTPNITPDPDTGIGGWSLDAFSRALREGVSPDGKHYYPSFPYTSYAGMRDEDIAAIKSWLDQQQPISNTVPDHELGFPFDQRWLMTGWKWLFFDEPPASESRGKYLVESLAHCGECHTPRNLFGALDREQWLAGTEDGPKGEAVPAIAPRFGGLKGWAAEDIAFSLKLGMMLDGDFFSGSMAEVVEHSTGHLSDADLQAIAEYLLKQRD